MSMAGAPCARSSPPACRARASWPRSWRRSPESRPVFPVTVDGPWLGHLAALIGRTYLIVLMPLALAFLVGLVGRSQAAGIGAALGLMIGEQVVAALLLNLGLDWTRAVVDLLPARSDQALLTHNTFGPVAVEPGALGEGRALLTLALYSVVCLAIAVVVFRRRDIRGTS